MLDLVAKLGEAISTNKHLEVSLALQEALWIEKEARYRELVRRLQNSLQKATLKARKFDKIEQRNRELEQKARTLASMAMSMTKY